MTDKCNIIYKYFFIRKISIFRFLRIIFSIKIFSTLIDRKTFILTLSHFFKNISIFFFTFQDYTRFYFFTQKLNQKLQNAIKLALKLHQLQILKKTKAQNAFAIWRQQKNCVPMKFANHSSRFDDSTKRKTRTILRNGSRCVPFKTRLLIFQAPSFSRHYNFKNSTQAFFDSLIRK